MFKVGSSVPLGERQSESLSLGDDGGVGIAVESLATGREKRATAGNRLLSLLDKECDDELELLFAENEEEEDVEFEEEEEVQLSEAELDLSTDEEDCAPTHENDDLAGEKEFQKQDRSERQKKRKAQVVFKRSRGVRKKVQIDPSTTSIAPGLRSKRKTERLSWAHVDADAPTRVSSRKQTVQNREVVHQRLIESEQARLKVMQQMEAAQKRKATARPKSLTQADRMDEATKIERRNAKSLNRWEESEKKRAEEQRAKLEALHSRQLTGPVITWWSGLAQWTDGKIAQLGVKDIRRAGYNERPTLKENQTGRERSEKLPDQVLNTSDDLCTAIPEILHPHQLMEPSEQTTLPIGSQNPTPQRIRFAPPHSPFGFLDGIHAYAAMPLQQQQAEFAGTADGNLHSHRFCGPRLQGQHDLRQYPSMKVEVSYPLIEFASGTLLAMKDIDANAVKLPELQSSVLLKKPRAKILSSSPMSRTLTFCLANQSHRAGLGNMRNYYAASQIS